MRRALCGVVVGALGLLVAGGGLSVYSQPLQTYGAEELTAGQVTNLFMQWEGEETVDGLRIELPRSWRIKSVWSSSSGSSEVNRTDPALDTLRSGLYRYAVASPTSSGARVALRVQVDDRVGYQEWRVTPFVGTSRGDSLLHSRSARSSVQVQGEQDMPEQYALEFSPSSQLIPVRTGEERLYELGMDQAFTVEYWMKSVHLNGVIMSSWTGEEGEEYPIEMMLDSRGYLLYFRGQGGLHHSLASDAPVADGKWHHVAVTYDPDERWTRLIVDGTAVDSMQTDPSTVSQTRAPLILGGRSSGTLVGNSPPDTSRGPAYRGLIDEFRLWEDTRSVQQVQDYMFREMAESQLGLIRYGFDEVVAEDGAETVTLYGGRVTMNLERTALRFHEPLKNLKAEATNTGVRITWEALSPRVKGYEVQRSQDGKQYESVGRVQVRATDRSGPASHDYTFTDPNRPRGVVYYRVRTMNETGGDNTDTESSPVAETVKLGLGGASEQEPVRLIGNFPNPFNQSTTIKFEVQRSVHVSLQVWDVSGHQQAELMDQTMEPGQYDIDFSPSDLPSGIYVIRLETPHGIHTNRMVLMR